MTETQLQEILTYFAIDKGVRVSDERRKLWQMQFGHIEYQLAIRAAMLLLSRKTYGFPQTSEFHEVLREVMATDDVEWATAWDTWVKIARRAGVYESDKAFECYAKHCPLGAKALGTMASEYFALQTDQVAVFRAQFRQRYVELQTSANKNLTVSPRLLAEIKELKRQRVEAPKEQTRRIA